jgi:hypothetical protein
MLKKTRIFNLFELVIVYIMNGLDFSLGNRYHTQTEDGLTINYISYVTITKDTFIEVYTFLTISKR